MFDGRPSYTQASAALVGTLSLLWASAAGAAHPASVQGVWSAAANRTTGSLVIVQPASAAACKLITGTIFGSAIEGAYCPASGRLVFVRKLANGVPFQLYEAHVSQDGPIDRLGGSLVIWNTTGGTVTTDGPDYNFAAAR